MSHPDPHPNRGSVPQYARHRKAHRRTIDAYLRNRYIRGYRIEGVRGIQIDFDEADAQLAALPSTMVRPGYGTRGGAEIITLVEPVVPAPAPSTPSDVDR